MAILTKEQIEEIEDMRVNASVREVLQKLIASHEELRKKIEELESAK